MTTHPLWLTFLQGLAQLDSTFTSCLNPPPDNLPEAMASMTVPYALPPGYSGLYEQGDGEQGQYSSGIFFGLRFLSLAEAQSLRTQWANEILDDEDDFLPPQEYHLPLFSDMTGNELCIDLEHGERIVMVGADYDEPELLTDSLHELMVWAVWMIRHPGHLKLERLQGLRTAISLADRTVVPNAIQYWKRTQQDHHR